MSPDCLQLYSNAILQTLVIPQRKQFLNLKLNIRFKWLLSSYKKKKKACSISMLVARRVDHFQFHGQIDKRVSRDQCHFKL